MTNPHRAGKVRLKPGILALERVESRGIRVPGTAYVADVVAAWNASARAYEVREIVIAGSEHVGITTTGLRELSVPDLVGIAMHREDVFVDENTGERLTSDVDGPTVRKLRGDPRSPESQLMASRIYAMSNAIGNSPSKAVAEVFDVDVRTVSRWIAAARSKGLLD